MIEINSGKKVLFDVLNKTDLSYGIWKERYFDFDWSDKCLNAAIQKYSIHKNTVDVDSSFSTNYTDNNYLGKLALGAIELYSATGDVNYLNDAIEYGDSAQLDDWWGWGILIR